MARAFGMVHGIPAELASDCSSSSEHDDTASDFQDSNVQTVPRTREPAPYRSRYQVQSDPAELAIPVYTSTTNWDAPICETDFLYRQQLAALRQRKHKVQRLAIFDFDNTLFKSPLPNPRLWDSKLVGMLMSTDLGWFHDRRTLSAPYLEYTDRHWVEPIVELARAEAQRDDTLVMLLTGRSHAAYRKVVLGLVGRCHGLRFDITILKETPTRQSPLVSPCIFGAAAKDAAAAPFTFDYKMGVVEDTIAAFPGIREIMMWDDRIGQCERMQHYLNALAARSDGWITAADIYHVPPQTIYMREDNERALIRDMVSEYNDRVRAAAGVVDCGQLPPGALEIYTYPSYAAVFLSPRSQAQLGRAVRSPRSWTRAASHMTVVLGPGAAGDLEQRVGAAHGERVTLVVDGVGTIPNAVIAVRVAEVRSRGCRRTPQTPGAPHITVAFNEPAGVQSSHARHIARWKPLHTGTMLLEGTVGEHMLTTATIVRPPVVRNDVSIGGLVCQHWPELKGREIGAAVSDVRQRMTEQGIENVEENRNRIAGIVADLF
ncbi:hypothetical protein H4R19_000206 [Coemansia spiralis]|nr:hypothetical protein H4R19_000206 [Coemansia spiralis]